MEELRPEELEALVQELEEESEQEQAAEPLPPDVEELLRVLQHGSLSLTRQQAAERLGKLDTSSPPIVQALVRAGDHDGDRQVRMAAAEALRAPVHQAVLQEQSQVRQSAGKTVRNLQPANTTLRIGSALPSARHKPASSTALLLRIAVGILLVGTGMANLQSRPGCFLICLPAGLVLIGWSLWEWRAPTSPRNRFLRSMKEAPAEIVKVLKEESRDYEGDRVVKYYLTVLFQAESAQGTNRDILLSLKVGSSLWRSATSGQIWTIRYSAEDPTIALIQGEW